MEPRTFAPFPIKTRARASRGAGAGDTIAVIHVGGDEPVVIDTRFARRLEATLHEVTRAGHISGAILCSDTPGELAGGLRLAQLYEVDTEAAADALLEPTARLFLRLLAMQKPIVAVVDGAATGAGFELALACSAIVATPAAACSLASPFVGYLPGHHGLQALASRVGPAEAARLALSGEVLGSERLRTLRVASSVAPTLSAALDDAAKLLERRSAGLPRLRGHHVVTGRAALSLFRRRALATACHHDVARERVFELLHVFLTGGFTASVALERRLAAELAIARTTKRLIRLATPPCGREAAGDFAARLQCAFVSEADALLAEGCTASTIDVALTRWGFERGPFALADQIGRARLTGWRQRFQQTLGDRFAESSPPSRMRPASSEEMQARCVLRLVNEAHHCLADGTVSDRLAADAMARAATGFPAFRGGPFAYAEDLGHEIGARSTTLANRFGSRFLPAPALGERVIDAAKP